MTTPKIPSRSAYAVQYLHRLMVNTAGLLGISPRAIVEKLAVMELDDDPKPNIDDVEAAFRMWPAHGEKIGPQHTQPIQSVPSQPADGNGPAADPVVSGNQPGDDQPGNP